MQIRRLTKGILFRHWAAENLRWVVDSRIRGEESLMVSAVIIDEHVIGPFYFDGNIVNGNTYLEMLQRNVLPALQDLNYQPLNIIYQQDGAPAHFRLDVRRWLNETMPNWIGRGGPVQWPPRSPDLTPLDFFCGLILKILCLQHSQIQSKN